jgi:hypothetical protein
MALKEPGRLAAYIFTYGSQEDVMALRCQITQDDLQRLLDAAPPGIYDPRSWACWNLMAGRDTTPPMPQRQLGLSLRTGGGIGPPKPAADASRIRKGRAQPDQRARSWQEHRRKCLAQPL